MSGLVLPISWLSRALGVSGQIVLVFMVVTICYDVMMRYLFAAPTAWSLEVNTFLVAFVALIPAADVLRTDDHLRITFLSDRLARRVRQAVDAFTCLLGIGFCAVMVWKGGAVAYQAWLYDERLSTPLGTPMVIPYLFMPVGFGVLGLQYLARLVLVLVEGPVTPGRDAAVKHQTSQI